MSAVLEEGDVFFLYRNVVGVDRAQSLDDVQHLFVVLHPDGSDEARLLVVGRKRLPDAGEDRGDPASRGWLMTLASEAPERMAGGFVPVEYDTETEGHRRQAEAIPVGSGRYAVQTGGDESFWVYRLHLPDDPGEAQRALGIREEAGYVVAVRNPDLDVPGFPDEEPDYPEELASSFADLRWMEVTDTRLLDPRGAQLVFIGAFDEVDPTGLELSSGASDFFDTFGLDRDRWPTAALEGGAFAEARYEPDARAPRSDRSRGGRIGGRRALDAPSAAGIAKALEGIRFPKDRAGLVEHARANGAEDEIVETLHALEDRRYEDMADVERALGEVR